MEKFVKKEQYLVRLITPSYETDVMLFNRFDIIYHENVFMLEVTAIDTKELWRVPVHIDGNVAVIGIWLLNIPFEGIKAICKFIIVHFHIRIVYYRNSLYAIGKADSSNQWVIELPGTIEELWMRVSKKNKYNYKWEMKKIYEEIGEVFYAEYSQRDIPNRLIQLFFEFKAEHMGTNYNMTYTEFIDYFHITHAYEMTVNGECLAMLLSCEYGDTAYLDNLSYNPIYKKYSCGKIIYAHYLERLVEKEKRKLYLGDGQQEYKKHFGSEQIITYGGGVYKNIVWRFLYTNKIILNLYVFLNRLFKYVNREK